MTPARRRKGAPAAPPQPGWAVYLRTSSEDHQKPDLSRARQRSIIDGNVLDHSDLPVIDEYVDMLTGKTPNHVGYQRLLADARAGKFSHVIVERADRFGRNDTEALRAIDELHEFGVAVRFANSPDLDPMDPDDRVLVALSFTLARRESSLLGIRVKGGQRAKRQSGGWCGQAPDGYRNVEERTTVEFKKQVGKFSRRIKIDPERAQIWREAWALLLEDKWTLPEIAEALHAKGYRHRSGRPFVEVQTDGTRKRNINTLSLTFHNWAYAGWVVSEKNGILPRTQHGNWEPIVTTEAFERGLAILARRNQHRVIKGRQTYLLAGLLDYRSSTGAVKRLTCSTSNTGRSDDGTAYYRDARAGGVSFPCGVINAAVAAELMRIQVAEALIPHLRACYQADIHRFMGAQNVQTVEELKAALKVIDDEEARTLRLYSSVRITEDVWNGLWGEWQDRRMQLRQVLYTVVADVSVHIDNLQTALEITAHIGTLYNALDHDDQYTILRHVVEKLRVRSVGFGER
jgi:DNA invertase Pin-like site-specific DNA recombinase